MHEARRRRIVGELLERRLAARIAQVEERERARRGGRAAMDRPGAWRARRPHSSPSRRRAPRRPSRAGSTLGVGEQRRRARRRARGPPRRPSVTAAAPRSVGASSRRRSPRAAACRLAFAVAGSNASARRIAARLARARHRATTRRAIASSASGGLVGVADAARIRHGVLCSCLRHRHVDRVIGEVIEHAADDRRHVADDAATPSCDACARALRDDIGVALAAQLLGRRRAARPCDASDRAAPCGR